MTYEEAREWVLGCIYHDGFVETKRGDMANKVIKDSLEKSKELSKVSGLMWESLFEQMEKDNADGCRGCAFTSTEEWEMPCTKCKRNSKDYWRAGNRLE